MKNKNIIALKKELLNLMCVKVTGEWGPEPIICRWCNAWLNNDEHDKHNSNCFAVKYLDQKSFK